MRLKEVTPELLRQQRHHQHWLYGADEEYTYCTWRAGHSDALQEANSNALVTWQWGHGEVMTW